MALISVADAGRRYGLSASWVRVLLQQGTVRGQKFGNSWAVDESSLKRYVETPRKRGPKPS